MRKILLRDAAAGWCLDLADEVDGRVGGGFDAGEQAGGCRCRGREGLLGVDVRAALGAGAVGGGGGGVRSLRGRKDWKVRMKDCSLHEKVYELLMWKGVEVRAFLWWFR